MPSNGGERILVVDDAPEALELLHRCLSSQGYEVLTAPGVAEALNLLDGAEVDLVITALRMPRASGLDLVRHVRENLQDAEVMMITGYATIEGAVEAVKMGAEEYLSKPFTEEELLASVRRACAKLYERRAARASARHRSQGQYGLIGQSEAMDKVLGAIEKAAATAANVLISGESGTGKELVARAIHYTSSRQAAPFVPVNCASIPESLLESELFGHIKGSFTGAAESRAGFFQTADGGTVFLDAIGETSLAVQVKLLRVVEDKEVYMVGSTRPRRVDVRIVASTDKDLLGRVKKGVFREDLYFRLNIINITLPPLRDRGGDIFLLAHHFAAKFARAEDREPPEFSENALSVLRDYHWPGNVRELESVVRRLVAKTDGGVIEVRALPSLLRFSALRKPTFNRSLAEVEAEHIINVLDSVGGNKTKASRILGIDRKTLREKLQRFRVSGDGEHRG